MRRITTATLAAAFALALSAAFAAASAKPDYSGTWKLDLSKSQGLPPNFKGQTMTVKQTGDRIEIQATVTTDEGEQEVSDAYVVDGKETDFTQKIGGMEGRGRRTSAWAADGSGVEVSENATLDTPDGPAQIKATRKWSLSADGKTLTIDMTIESPMGTLVTKRVFVKS